MPRPQRPRPERPQRPQRPSRPSRPDRPGNSVTPSPSSPAPAPTPVPEVPPISRTILQPTKEPVKPASPDIILFNDDLVPIEVMADLLFEEIGGQELINIARNDTINGQSTVYRPIKNLSKLALRYSPLNIVALQNTSNSYFNNFPIKLDERTPLNGNGPGGLTVYAQNVLGTATTLASTNIIIEVVNIEDDERVEVQILTNGDVLSDTIYIDVTEEES